jgi:hypothetical protein
VDEFQPTILPCSVLWVAWKRASNAGLDEFRLFGVHPLERPLSLPQTCAMALSFTFLFSYLHNGGGIPGSRTLPRLWSALGPISTGTSAASLLSAAIGRGKGKLLLIGRLFGVFAARQVIFGSLFD